MEKVKRKIYILSGYVAEGSAEFNRFVAYSKGFISHGFDVEIISFRVLNVHGSFDPVKIKGLFATKMSVKILRYPLSFFSLLLFILFKVKADDELILYSNGEYIPLFVLFRKGNVWHEMTECPFIVGNQKRFLKVYFNYCRKIRGIFVISKNLKDFYISNGIDPNKIHVINMIVDSSRFDKVDKIERNTNQERYIAYCGNVYDDSKDGIFNLLKAFVEFNKHCPRISLYLAGKIESTKQKDKYDEFLCQNSIADKVYFMGQLPPNEIPSLLINAEFLMLTRPANIQAKYGFPTKLGEYLLSRRPVIVTRVGNIDSFLCHKKDVILVDPNDSHGIISEMIWLCNNPNLANEIGKNGRLCALKNFDNIEETKKILMAMGIQP